MVYVEGRKKTEVTGEKVGDVDNRKFYTKIVARTVKFLDRTGGGASVADVADVESTENIPF